MVNEKQPFYLRCAVLYCFQSFLNKNELGQSQIVQTLLPSTADGKSIQILSILLFTVPYLKQCQYSLFSQVLYKSICNSFVIPFQPLQSQQDSFYAEACLVQIHSQRGLPPLLCYTQYRIMQRKKNNC